MPHVLPSLPYSPNALEPHLDARTLTLHHDRHHASYVKGLNEALEGQAALQELSVDQLLTRLGELPESIRESVRNQGGGHFNHSLFWKVMKPGGGGEPSGELANAIRGTFGSFDAFRTEFSKAALGHFGSGWAWLTFHGRQLAVSSTSNQDCPLSGGRQPLLLLDLWEHAYYLEYQNVRKAYVEAWWNVVDWNCVAENLKRARG